VIVILRNVLGEDDFEIVRGKSFDIGIVSNVKIVVPICELIIAGIGKANQREQADCAYDE